MRGEFSDGEVRLLCANEELDHRRRSTQPATLQHREGL